MNKTKINKNKINNHSTKIFLKERILILPNDEIFILINFFIIWYK